MGKGEGVVRGGRREGSEGERRSRERRSENRSTVKTVRRAVENCAEHNALKGREKGGRPERVGPDLEQ